MQCPTCATDLPQGARYCVNCGNMIPYNVSNERERQREPLAVPSLPRTPVPREATSYGLWPNGVEQPPPSSTSEPEPVQAPLPSPVTANPLPTAPQPSTTQLLAKLVSVLQSNMSQTASSDRSSISRRKASILLYVVVIGVIVCIGGIVLDQHRILPTNLTSIATAVSAFVTFIAGGWAVLERLFPRHLWQNAAKLPVLAACLVTIVMLLIPTTLYLSARTDPYIHQGLLGLDDPLTGRSEYQWAEYQNWKGGTCQFKEGTYHVSQVPQQVTTGLVCQAYGSKHLRNFVYEVQVKIIQGYGGIVFRDDVWNNSYYDFYIAANGKYWMEAYVNGQRKAKLAEGSSLSTGTNYKIAVIAQDSTITVYVNQQVVVWQRAISNDLDSAISSGQIGVMATYITLLPATSPPAEAEFNNAKVWEL